MKPSGHNNDKGEQKIQTINLYKKAERSASAGQIVREISKGSVKGHVRWTGRFTTVLSVNLPIMLG